MPLPLVMALLAAASAQTPPPLFQTPEPLVLELRTDLRALFRDRTEKRVEYPGTLRFSGGADTGSVKVELRTRGIFRLKLCPFPPIRIDLPAKKVEHTSFAGQDKLKLVTHCRGDRYSERNLLKEYALYRVFNAVTDSSFRVRLAHITYVDTTRADTVTRYGFFIESDQALAQRLSTVVLEVDKVHDATTNPSYITLVAVFQYLIGNTDWSVWGRHNIAILRDTLGSRGLLAVPYDFDFSGAINAPYAVPAEQLPIKSVRERWYRGFCQPDTVLSGAIARFRAAKDSIYAAVRAVPALPDGDIKNLLGYFDGFFRDLDDRGTLQRDLGRHCRAIAQ